MKSIAFRRRATDRIMKTLFLLSVFLVILPLFLIFFDLLWKGAKELKWSLLTDLPRPVGEPGGGIANGITGTLTLAGLAMAGGIPLAVLSGIYLAEYGKGVLASLVRFAVDLLAGVPSIIMGIFGYVLWVLPMKRFSAWAGASALAMIFIPIVVRTTEEMLRTVPVSVREAALRKIYPHLFADLEHGIGKLRAFLYGGRGMEDHALHHRSHGIGRNHHGDSPGDGADPRGDGTAAVHGAGEPVLADGTGPADRGGAAAGVLLRDFTV